MSDYVYPPPLSRGHTLVAASAIGQVVAVYEGQLCWSLRFISSGEVVGPALFVLGSDVVGAQQLVRAVSDYCLAHGLSFLEASSKLYTEALRKLKVRFEGRRLSEPMSDDDFDILFTRLAESAVSPSPFDSLPRPVEQFTFTNLDVDGN